MRVALPMDGGLAGTIGRRGFGRDLEAVLGYVALSIRAGELTTNWGFTVSCDVLWGSKSVEVQERIVTMIDEDAWRRAPAAGMMLMNSDLQAPLNGRQRNGGDAEN